MKTVKVSELIGAALDWAVAKYEGIEVQAPCRVMVGSEAYGPKGCAPRCVYSSAFGNPYSPSTDGGVAIHIIEREKLQLQTSLGEWVASTPKAVEIGGCRKYCFTSGPTLLVAAMRCLCQAKLGDQVEIPQELLP